MSHPSSQRGFTLVELSIVLVIIGLIVGGVLVGQSLIQAARVRAQLTQLDQLDAAMNTFRARFECLPGDCTPASGASNAAGNGDGLVAYSDTWAVDLESPLAWHQLGQTQMVAGSYTPNAAFDGTATDATGPAAQIGAAKLGGFIMIGSDATSNLYVLANYVAANLNTSARISAAAALAIDQKRDNGLFDSGAVRAIAGGDDTPFAAAVATAGTDADDCILDAATDAYQSASEEAICVLRVRVSG